jgi:hypothetical protein
MRNAPPTNLHPAGSDKCVADVCPVSPKRVVSIVAGMMNEGDNIERRVERAVFETDRHMIVGDVTLPPAGYQSRFSDSLNRGDLSFVPLTNVEMTSLLDGKVSERPFIVLSKHHIRLSYPIAR